MSFSPALTTHEVLQLAKIPYTTLDYWVRMRLVKPSIQQSSAAGRRARRWSLDDVLRVRALRELSTAGCPTRLLVKARAQLDARWKQTLTSRMLYWDGGDVFLVDDWENVISLVKRPGQSAIRVAIFPLGSFAEQIAADYAALQKQKATLAADLALRTAAFSRENSERTA